MSFTDSLASGTSQTTRTSSNNIFLLSVLFCYFSLCTNNQQNKTVDVSRIQTLIVGIDGSPLKNNGPSTASFSFIFGLFQTNNKTIFTTNQCEKCPSSIRCWDLNPRPSKHESHPPSTGPGLPPKYFVFFVPKFPIFRLVYQDVPPNLGSLSCWVQMTQSVLANLMSSRTEKIRPGPYLWTVNID